MKNLLTLLALAAFGFALIGCAKTEEAPATDTKTAAPTSEPMKPAAEAPAK